MRQSPWWLASLAAAALSSSAGAQATPADPTDVQARFGLGLALDLPDRWAAAFRYQYRLVDDLARYQGSYLSAGLERGIGDHFTILANYRLALVDRGTYHRFGLGVEASAKVKKVKFSFRPQVQFQRQHFDNDDEFGSDDDVFLRTRAAVKLDLTKRLAVSASVEPYFKFGAKDLVDNWRNTLGLDYRVSKRLKVEGYYIYRPDYGKSYNRTFHIVGAGMELGLKPFRKKVKAKGPKAEPGRVGSDRRRQAPPEVQPIDP